jgi:hypothetical protein
MQHGITIRDLDDLTVGMVLGIIATYHNEHDSQSQEPSVRMATQADFDRW